VINPEPDPRYRDYRSEHYRLTERTGISESTAKIEMRRRATLIKAMAIHRGDADGMLCGTFGTHGLHLQFFDQVLCGRTGVPTYAAMNAVMLPGRTVFVADACVNPDPTTEVAAEIILLAAEELRRFSLTSKVALLSHSPFGTSDHPQAQKMRQALVLLNALDPGLEVEGEMHRDAARSEDVRLAAFPNSRLKGAANLLIMPTLGAANISFNLLKASGEGNVTLGPILLGVARPVRILSPLATVRRIVNMTALTAVDAGDERFAAPRPPGPLTKARRGRQGSAARERSAFREERPCDAARAQHRCASTGFRLQPRYGGRR